MEWVSLRTTRAVNDEHKSIVLRVLNNKTTLDTKRVLMRIVREQRAIQWANSQHTDIRPTSHCPLFTSLKAYDDIGLFRVYCFCAYCFDEILLFLSQCSVRYIYAVSYFVWKINKLIERKRPQIVVNGVGSTPSIFIGQHAYKPMLLNWNTPME